MTPRYFIDKYGLRIESVCIDPGDWREKPSRWKVKLYRKREEHPQNYPGHLIGEFDYQQGSAFRVYSVHPYTKTPSKRRIRIPYGGRRGITVREAEALDRSLPMEPDIESVIYCLGMDCLYLDQCSDVWEFFEETGMEPSREGARTYDAMLDNARLLKQGLGREAFAELCALEEE